MTLLFWRIIAGHKRSVSVTRLRIGLDELLERPAA